MGGRSREYFNISSCTMDRVYFYFCAMIGMCALIILENTSVSVEVGHVSFQNI